MRHLFINMLNKLPHNCPSCNGSLNVKSLFCKECQTEITGEFQLPLLARLETEDQQFIVAFVRFSGNLKKMAEKMKLSYPTVRNMLDEIILKIKP